MWLRKQLETGDNDLLREMVRNLAEELMGRSRCDVRHRLWGDLGGPGQSPQRLWAEGWTAQQSAASAE